MSSMLSVSRRTALEAFRRVPVAAGAGAGARLALVSAPAAAARGSRSMSTSPALRTAYNYVWRSNVTNVTYVVVGAVILEMMYGSLTDSIFDMVNKGKQYHDIDWSKFKEEDEEEEEEEDEEDE